MKKLILLITVILTLAITLKAQKGTARKSISELNVEHKKMGLPELPEKEFMNLKKFKVSKDIKKIHTATVPQATEWCDKVDKLIKAKDLDGLENLKWEYVYFDYGSGRSSDVSIVKVNTTILPNFSLRGGNEDIFYEYWNKVGITMAINGRLGYIAEDHIKITPTKDNRGAKLYETVHIKKQLELLKAIRSEFEKKGGDFNKEIVKLLNNSSIDKSERNGYAYYYMRNYFTELDIYDKEVIESLMPYYHAHEQWIFYLSSANYKPAIPKFYEALKNEDVDTRAEAVIALGRMKVKEALPKLELIAKSDTYYYVDNDLYKVYPVRDRAKEAIQKIKL